MTGFTRGSPDFAPTVCSTTRRRPKRSTVPALSWNCWRMASFQLVMPPILPRAARSCGSDHRREQLDLVEVAEVGQLEVDPAAADRGQLRDPLGDDVRGAEDPAGALPLGIGGAQGAGAPHRLR